MTLKVDINAGSMTSRGQEMGCRDGQVYAVVYDTSRKVVTGRVSHYPEMFVGTPQDSADAARGEAQAWATSQGHGDLGANMERLVITGNEADIRANSPRW
jgi:hypothetical protein